MAKRNKKGSVSVHNRNGMLRLRWRYVGKEISLSMGLPDTQINRAGAEKLAAKIQIDIALGEFDHSLARYRPQQPTMATDTLGLLDEFIAHKESQGLQRQTINCHYKSLRPYLKSFGKAITNQRQAEQVVAAIRKRQNPKGANHTLIRLKAFGRWAVENGHWNHNPFELIKPQRVIRNNIDIKRNPFSKEEVKQLLQTIAKDPQLRHYYAFTLCLFALGLRPSEAIGLRWRYVDLKQKRVTIAEAMVRIDGERQQLRKGTKNGIIRQLDLIDLVVQVLTDLKPNDAQPDDLVFTTPMGRPINGSNYRYHCWKKGIEKAGIPYRPPYTARHTFISWGLEMEGWSLPQAAALAGNSVMVMADTYAHMVDRPAMPDLDIP